MKTVRGLRAELVLQMEGKQGSKWSRPRVLFLPTCFREDSRVLGKLLCPFQEGSVSCSPGPHRSWEQPLGSPSAAGPGAVTAAASVAPPVPGLPLLSEQQNARPAAPGRDLLIKARLFNPSVHSPDLRSRT